jgi:predicted permease
MLADDAVLAFRILRRRPLFTAVVVGSLALAIGATTAILTVVNGVLLRPLPFTDANELVQVFGGIWRTEISGAADPIDGPIGSRELEAFQTRSRTLASLAGYSTGASILDGADGPERLTAVTADLNLFTLLGAVPAAGRPFRSGDPLSVAVISDALWARRWRRDPKAIGQGVTVDGQPVTILGVMPAAFQFPYSAASVLPGAQPETRTDIWRVLPPVRGADATLRRGRVSVVARLHPGQTAESASLELAAIAARLDPPPGAPPARFVARATALSEIVSAGSRDLLWVLFGAAALVLAAACANVGNLQLAQMTSRLREVTTRAALGARPTRLVRQALAESLLLSVPAGLTGLLLAHASLEVIVPIAAPYLARAHEVSIDWRVFAFAVTVSIATAAVFGLAPAIAAARVDAVAVMKEGGHATIGRRFARLRDALVVVEVALAAALAFGAVTVIREMWRLQAGPDGLTRADVLTLHLSPRVAPRQYDAIVDAVAQLPGVEAAGMIQLVPLQHWSWEGSFVVRGRGGPPMVTELRYVTPGYFETVEVPVLRGRGFTSRDTADTDPVILVNNALAQRYFPNEDPVGLRTDRGTIVGVVGDVRQMGLNRPPAPEIYYPVAQNVATTSDAGMSLMVRTSVGPPALLPAITSAVRSVAPALAIFNVKTLAEVRRESLAEVVLYQWLIGAFATLALTLSAIGLGGVIAYHAGARTREFAVRLALGAAPAALARAIVGRAMMLLAAGLVGAFAAVVLLAPLARVVPGVSSALADPVAYAAVALLVLAAGCAASLGPAARTALLHPVSVLRHE